MKKIVVFSIILFFTYSVKAEKIYFDPFEGPFSSSHAACWVYTKRDYTSYKGQFTLDDSEQRVGLKTLSEAEERGRVYGAMFKAGGLGQVDLSEWQDEVQTILKLFEDHNFSPIYDIIKPCIDPNKVITYRELHDFWGRQTYPWYKNVFDMRTSVDVDRAHGIVNFSRNGQRFAVFKPCNRVSFMDAWDGITSPLQRQDKSWYSNSSQVHTPDRFNNQLAARTLIKLLGHSDAIAPGIVGSYVVNGKRLEGLFEEFLPAFVKEDLKDQEDRDGLLFKIVKYAYEKNVDDLRDKSFDSYWNPNVSCNLIAMIEYIINRNYDRLTCRTQEKIQAEAPALWDVGRVRELNFLLFILGGIGDWNGGNLLTCFRHSKLDLRLNDFEQAFFSDSQKSFGVMGGTELLPLLKKDTSAGIMHHSKQLYHGVLGHFYLHSIYQQPVEMAQSFTTRLSIAEELIGLDSQKFFAELKNVYEKLRKHQAQFYKKQHGSISFMSANFEKTRWTDFFQGKKQHPLFDLQYKESRGYDSLLGGGDISHWMFCFAELKNHLIPAPQAV